MVLRDLGKHPCVSDASARRDRGLARDLTRAVRGAWEVQWDALHPVAALSCLPVILLCLGVGLLRGELFLGSIAASGAFSVGFGLFQRLAGAEALPMVLAAAGMTVAAALGTLADVTPVLEAAASALCGFALGLATALGTASWWVVLQWSIALVIAASFPADMPHALLRGALVAAGGLAQLAVTSLSWRLAGQSFSRLWAPPPDAAGDESRSLRSALRDAMRWRSPRLRYALTLAAAVGAATILFRVTALSNGYWMPMTVLIVLRYSRQDTVAFTFARIAGTVSAAGLVTAALALARPAPMFLVIMSGAFAWACYALLRVNYAIFSFGITGYVIMLFALAGLPEPDVALHRTLATTIGGIIALAACFGARPRAG